MRFFLCGLKRCARRSQLTVEGPFGFGHLTGQLPLLFCQPRKFAYSLSFHLFQISLRCLDRFSIGHTFRRRFRRFDFASFRRLSRFRFLWQMFCPRCRFASVNASLDPNIRANTVPGRSSAAFRMSLSVVNRRHPLMEEILMDTPCRECSFLRGRRNNRVVKPRWVRNTFSCRFGTIIALSGNLIRLFKFLNRPKVHREHQ